jgi:hypothetical protein
MDWQQSSYLQRRAKALISNHLPRNTTAWIYWVPYAQLAAPHVSIARILHLQAYFQRGANHC